MDPITLKAIGCFGGAGVCGLVPWASHKGLLAALPTDLKWLAEGSAWMILVVCLIFALKYVLGMNSELRKELKAERKAFDDTLRIERKKRERDQQDREKEREREQQEREREQQEREKKLVDTIEGLSNEMRENRRAHERRRIDNQ